MRYLRGDGRVTAVMSKFFIDDLLGIGIPSLGISVPSHYSSFFGFSVENLADIAILAKQLFDVLLLAGRQGAVAVTIAVVGSVAAEVAGQHLSQVIAGITAPHFVVSLVEAQRPSFGHDVWVALVISHGLFSFGFILY